MKGLQVILDYLACWKSGQKTKSGAAVLLLGLAAKEIGISEAEIMNTVEVGLIAAGSV